MTLEVFLEFGGREAKPRSHSNRRQPVALEKVIQLPARHAQKPSRVVHRQKRTRQCLGMRVDAHDASLNTERGTPGKPVSAVAFLALLAGAQDIDPGDETGLEKLDRKAAAWNVIFERLDVLSCGGAADHACVVNFVQWWQSEALLRPLPGSDHRDFVPLPRETEIHHHVLDRVLAARRHMLERRARARLPDFFAVPCKECGLIFKTEAPRFARTCPTCQGAGAYPQRLGVHETGGLPVFTGGFYPRGPQRRQYGWPTVCEHPECVSVFVANRRHQKYCPAHTRLSALQAKRRLGIPKHKLFRFFPNYTLCDEGSEIREEFMIDGESRVCIIGPAGYQARDEAEFRPLVARAVATDLLRIVSTV
jgi:hypothetical protein